MSWQNYPGVVGTSFVKNETTPMHNVKDPKLEQQQSEKINDNGF